MTSHPVDVWTVCLTDDSPAILTPDEFDRAARFKFDPDRIRWTRARSSLRQVLATYAQVEPDGLVFAYGEHGKPSLQDFPEIQFNLSHAGDYAMIVVSINVAAGIDIEHMRPNIDMVPLLSRLGEEDLPDDPPALYQRWTLREARSKAAGGALFTTPPPDIHAVPLAAPAGYSAALALVKHTPDPQHCAYLPPPGGNL